MRPIIEKGDHLEVLSNVQSYQVGDIVVLRIQGELIVHRIVDISRGPGDERFITKGDMMSRCDEPVDGNHIYGKVVTISKAKSGRKIDCTRLSRLFSIIAWLSLKCIRFEEFVRSSYGGQTSTSQRTETPFMKMWIKLFYILIGTAMELHNLKYTYDPKSLQKSSRKSST